MEKRILNAGCKTAKEYRDKIAQIAGYENYNERFNEWRYKTGRRSPSEVDEECSKYFGDLAENYVMKTFEDPIKAPTNNPQFDWTCKNGYKVEHKARRIQYYPRKNLIGNLTR